MKKSVLLLIIPLLFTTSNSPAQELILSDHILGDITSNWIKIKKDANLSAETFLTQFQEELGFSKSNSFVLVKKYSDDLGFEHRKFDQYFQNVRVEGAQYVLHSKNDRLIKLNGSPVRNVACNTFPLVSSEQAIENCLRYVNAEKYYWQDPAKEALLKKIKNDPSATFYPNPELVISDPAYSGEGAKYKLCWKVEIYAEKLMDKEIVFVNANDGSILYTLDGCVTGSGTAVTRYDGTQTICTDSVGPNLFTLIDSTRGGGVFTYDMNKGTDLSTAVHFEDSNNYWNNANPELDDAATDCHWGMEMTYDYFKQKHNRLSFDNNDGAIISYVHVDNNWFNATWNGLYARFGDGNGNPLTSIDVAAHELVHGVTDYTSDLIYRNESGALNESFSDIFGSAVKNFALGINNDWSIGTANFQLRSISNPKSFGDPDTYFGQFWATGGNDNGGVHTNSGVQNYWYYILSVGDTGVNDLGNSYAVGGLGRDIAEAIAYRNQFAYLSRNSNYFDARQGSIEAAEDLYGPCSYEVMQTAKAWYAVGVGPDTITKDLRLLTYSGPGDGCNLSSSEQLAVTFMFNETGCGGIVPAGDTINIGFQIDNDPAVIEQLILPASIQAGDTLNYSFVTGADLSAEKTYTVKLFLHYGFDEFAANDSILSITIKKPISLFNDDLINFEDRANTYDSLYIDAGDHAQVLIQHRAAAHGSDWGMQMGGLNADTSLITMTGNEADNFNMNSRFGGKFCFCVDATGWTDARMVFDLRQTYSRVYKDVFGWGTIPELVSSMRILVDDMQIGNQYHPATNDSDLFVTHIINLDSYAGAPFEACFESRHFIRWQEDFLLKSNGDHTFVDNIFFTNQANVGISESNETLFEIYPNPSKGIFSVWVSHQFIGNSILEVYDVTGRILFTSPGLINSGSTLIVDLSDQSEGVYFLRIRSGEQTATRRVILN